MPGDTDLSGMDYNSALEYVKQYILSLKQTERKIEELESELNTWRERAELAASKDRSDLQAKAISKMEDTKYQLESLRSERNQLVFEVSEMKRQLQEIKNQPQASVNADFLLSQLEGIVGERDELSDKFKEEEADAALEELKRKMRDEEGNT